MAEIYLINAGFFRLDEEKEKMLSKVCLEKWLIYFYHDPDYEKASEEPIAKITEVNRNN